MHLLHIVYMYVSLIVLAHVMIPETHIICSTLSAIPVQCGLYYVDGCRTCAFCAH